MTRAQVLVSSVALGWLVAGCRPNADPALLTRATATSGDITVELLSRKPLAVGLNRLSYRVTKGGRAVTQANIEQKPLAKMSSMEHRCPEMSPGKDADADGLFQGVIIFNMPSGEEIWSLELDVMPSGASSATVLTFEGLTVADSTDAKTITVGTDTYLVTLSFAKGPAVGVNDVTVSAHKPQDATAMVFVPVVDLSLALTPEMPSMGHGTSGNVDPVHAGQGLYDGKLNFTMSGDWRVTLKATAPGGQILTGASGLEFDYVL
jgi:hypothetical protein